MEIQGRPGNMVDNRTQLESREPVSRVSDLSQFAPRGLVGEVSVRRNISSSPCVVICQYNEGLYSGRIIDWSAISTAVKSREGWIGCCLLIQKRTTC